MKVSIKVQKIVGTLSRMRSRMSVSCKCIFLGEDHQKGNIIFVIFSYTYIQKISYLHVFLEKDHLSFSVETKNIIFSGKKLPSFQIYKKDYISESFFWKDHVFGAFERNIVFPCIF